MSVEDLASPDFDIPESKDGFFTYNEEKNLQSIGEKKWANTPSHRRPSESSTSSAGLGLRASVLGPLTTFQDVVGSAIVSAPTAINSPDPFAEDMDREVETDAQVNGTS